jgi:hypothetical protein
VTSTDFRTIALSFPEVEEKSHFDHPDFRVGGKVFATLGYPREGWGMVKLPPEQQKGSVESHPDSFVRVNGSWGLKGATSVQLRTSRKADVRRALIAAWHNIAPKRLSDRIDVQ